MVHNVIIAYILCLVVFPFIGYLIGSFNASIFISLLIKKQDIRELESKNAGATNMIRVYGKRLGFVAMIIDILKPILVISINYIVYKYALKSPVDFYSNFNITVLVYFCGIFVLLGHAFPIYFKFKGGKGVSCYGGFLIALDPIVAIIGIFIILLVLYLSKYMSLASMLAASITPFLILIPGINYIPFYNEDFASYFLDSTAMFDVINETWYLFFIALFQAMFVVFLHRSNILSMMLKKERLTFLSKHQKQRYDAKLKQKQVIKN